jgi:hypothetical protein
MWRYRHTTRRSHRRAKQPKFRGTGLKRGRVRVFRPVHRASVYRPVLKAARPVQLAGRAACSSRRWRDTTAPRRHGKARRRNGPVPDSRAAFRQVPSDERAVEDHADDADRERHEVEQRCRREAEPGEERAGRHRPASRTASRHGTPRSSRRPPCGQAPASGLPEQGSVGRGPQNSGAEPAARFRSDGRGYFTPSPTGIRCSSCAPSAVRPDTTRDLPSAVRSKPDTSGKGGLKERVTFRALRSMNAI